jgi:hypothetical protein
MFPPDPVLAPEARRGGPSQGRAYDAPKVDLRLSGFSLARRHEPEKLQIAQEVSTMRRPTACIELDRARRAGPSPCGEQHRRCPPARRCSLAPAGQPPLKLTAAATSAAPGAATLSAQRRVSTPYPLSSVVSGAVLPPGHKSRSHARSPPCCATGCVAGRCGGSCCGAPAQRPNKINAVAVLQLRGWA